MVVHTKTSDILMKSSVWKWFKDGNAFCFFAYEIITPYNFHIAQGSASSPTTYLDHHISKNIGQIGSWKAQVQAGFFMFKTNLRKTNHHLQGGPLSVINGIITPISRVITPVTHL